MSCGPARTAGVKFVIGLVASPTHLVQSCALVDFGFLGCIDYEGFDWAFVGY